MSRRFDRSHKMVMTSLYAAIGLQLLAVIVAKAEAMSVLTVGVPALIAGAFGWTHVVNKAETERPQLPPPQEHGE